MFTRGALIIFVVQHLLCVLFAPLALRAHEGDTRYAFTDGAVMYIIILPLYVDRSGELF